MSISSAKASFGALIKRVEGGQDVVITRHGRPAAALSRGKARRYTVRELFK
jgi:prevent-host-death family protein